MDVRVVAATHPSTDRTAPGSPRAKLGEDVEAAHVLEAEIEADRGERARRVRRGSCPVSRTWSTGSRPPRATRPLGGERPRRRRRSRSARPSRGWSRSRACPSGGSSAPLAAATLRHDSAMLRGVEMARIAVVRPGPARRIRARPCPSRPRPVRRRHPAAATRGESRRRPSCTSWCASTSRLF